MTLEHIESRIKELEEQIKPLVTTLATLKPERRRLKSIAWIQANNVLADDVELSAGDGKPWFGHVLAFGKWLAGNSTKRFCEWNKTIYVTAEIVTGRMDPDAPGYVTDLGNG